MIQTDNKLSYPLYFICKNCCKKLYSCNELFMQHDTIFCSKYCRYNYWSLLNNNKELK